MAPANPSDIRRFRFSLRGAWLAVALAVPLAAAAEPAFTRGAANLRAGPGTNYPPVVQLRPGQQLDVVGCTSGYAWCDVVLPDGLRGWVSASLLDYPWDGGSRVPLATYGAMIGVPIIAFALGSYWNDHYRDRPWYREQRWWGNRPPPPPQAGWRPVPPPTIGWQPRPPQPGWRPPPQARPPVQVRPPQRPPGWQQPGRPPPNWQGPNRPPPGFQGPGNQPRPPHVNPRPPRPQGPPGMQGGPRPPGAQGRPGRGPGAGGPPPRPPGGARGTLHQGPRQGPGDRP